MKQPSIFYLNLGGKIVYVYALSKKQIAEHFGCSTYSLKGWCSKTRKTLNEASQSRDVEVINIMN